MTDHPVLFSGAMVRALLDGRKTMTRRLAWRPAREGEPTGVGSRLAYIPNDETGVGTVTGHYRPSPWRNIKAGDRLWVREAWRCNGWATDVATIFYRANERDGYTAMCEQYPISGRKPLRVTGTWRPGIHMPRWASRLTLDVSGVKIERLQDISEADAIAEGADPIIDHGTGSTPYLHRIGFEHLWCSLHGETAWIENPEVVAISFKVGKANVDAPEALAA